MNELKLKFENTIFYNGIEDYIGTLKGVKEVKMDKENNEIYVKYDSSIISILVLQNEILLFLNSLRIPAIVGFNKYSKNITKKRYFSIKDICCEYCLMGFIQDLLLIDGIELADINFEDYLFADRDIPLYIEYDESIISYEEIEKYIENC